MSQLSAEPTLETAPKGKPLDSDCHPLFREVPSSVEFKKLRKRLLRETRQAISDYKMVPDGATPEKTKWLICLSGGKDSYTLLAVLMDLKWRGLLPVDLIACNLDQSQPVSRNISCQNFLSAMRFRTRSCVRTLMVL